MRSLAEATEKREGSGGMMDKWIIGSMGKDWGGIMENWNTGVMDNRNIGLMDDWSAV